MEGDKVLPDNKTTGRSPFYWAPPGKSYCVGEMFGSLLTSSRERGGFSPEDHGGDLIALTTPGTLGVQRSHTHGPFWSFLI